MKPVKTQSKKQNSSSQSKEKSLQKAYTSTKKEMKPTRNPENNIFRPKINNSKVIPDNGKHSTPNPKSKSKTKSKSKSREKSFKQSESLKSLEQIYAGSKAKRVEAFDNVEAIVTQCLRLMEKSKLKQAKRLMEKALKSHSKMPKIYYYLGRISEEEGIYESARNYYSTFVGMVKDSNDKWRHYQNLAKSYFFLKNFKEVIEAASKGLEKKQSASMYLLKGKAQMLMKDYGPALDSLDSASSLDSRNLEISELKGDCLKSMSAYGMALKEYNKVAGKLKTESLKLIEKMLECYEALGNKEKSASLKRRIKQLKNDSTGAMEILMPWLVKGLGRGQEAGVAGQANNGNDNPKVSQPSSSNDSRHMISSCNSIPLQGGSEAFELRLNSPTLQDAEKYINMNQLLISLKILNKVVQESSETNNIKALQMRALVNFKLENFDACEEDINEAIKSLSNPILPLIGLLLPDIDDRRMLGTLQFLSAQLKELNAYNLTESEDRLILERRRKCLRDALDALQQRGGEKSILSSHLHVIMERSSVVNSIVTRGEDTNMNEIFLLRSIRRVLQNWVQHNFSLESMEETTDLAYQMVKIKEKEFSILPLHIIYYFLEQDGQLSTFEGLNNQVGSMLKTLCQKYPPNGKIVSNSLISNFSVDFEPLPKINLFGIYSRFKSYKELHKAISKLGDKANREVEKMRRICQRICVENHQGTGFKIGLKLGKNEDESILQERVFCRIVEKMLSEEIKAKKSSFYSKITIHPTKTPKDYFQEVQAEWEHTIDDIIKEKAARNENIVCHVYDFMRAKCMYSSVRAIERVVRDFMAASQLGEISLLEVDNRLRYKTRDVVLKFRVNEVVGELQLAMEFESMQNEFNHGLYELFRSPFGPFFASVMWFSGFGLKKNKLFIRQNMKWDLRRLPHLRKFIYEDQLAISLTNVTTGDYYYLNISNFEADSLSLTCSISNHLGEYYKQEQSGLELCSEAPDKKFVIEVQEGNLIVSQNNVMVRIRAENTSCFLTGDGKHLASKSLADSQGADLFKMTVEEKGKDYSDMIKKCRQLEKEVLAKLAF